MPSEPTKSGYIFGGWYTSRYGGSQFTGSTMVTGNITVYAKWAAAYTATFDADDGTPGIQTKAVKRSGAVGSSNMPSEPTKSGYIFGGWYTSWNGDGVEFTSSTTVIEDITVYAKWTAAYMITFNAGGGIPETQTRAVEIDGMLGSSNMPPAPTRSHHIFGGWYTSSDGNGSRFTGSTTVTGDITVYAKWAAIIYTVTFDIGEGSSGTDARTVNGGEALGSSNMLPDPARNGYTFGGWYTSRYGCGVEFTNSTAVTGNITVYAKWTANPMPSNSLAQALEWLDVHAVEGGAYTISLNADETFGPKTLSYSGKSISLTLKGTVSERRVRLSGSGSFFTVESGVTLTLGADITLEGRSGNTNSLIRVNSGGRLTMNSGSKITGNSSSNGGGVYVSSGGTFTMNGGTISGNTSSSSGGGVHVSGGTFIMNDGEISGNTSSNGGGVYVSSGTFTMNDGAISGNTSSSSGGGVYVSSGTFTKQSGGVIYGSNISEPLKNTARNGDVYGHAVYSNGKKRNTTAGFGVTLDGSINGASGGWE
jgi:uncharacterized repeat protein (TIGR02543 family)